MFKAVLISASVLLFSVAGHTKTIFACETTSKLLAPGKKMHLKLTQKPTREYTLEIGGVEAHSGNGEHINDTMVSLTNLDQYLKCSSYDPACQDKVSAGKGDGYQDFGNVLAFALAIDKSVPEAKGSNSLTKLKVSQITSGKSYIMAVKDKVSKFGNMGVYEYYDKSNKLLGRYLYALEVIDCKDKEKPSTPAAQINKNSDSVNLNR